MNKIEDMIDKLPYIEFEYNGGRGYGKSYIAEIIEEKDKEIQHLKSIIKEAREYIYENKEATDYSGDRFIYLDEDDIENIFKILDKENNNEM